MEFGIVHHDDNEKWETIYDEQDINTKSWKN